MSSPTPKKQARATRAEPIAAGGAALAAPAPIRFGAELAADFERASALEWLETDGLGGWASSTLAGAHTRRYHGMLIAATRPPAGRRMLVSRLDETVVTPVERVELGANRYPGAIHPKGFERLQEFVLGWNPAFTYAGKSFQLRKEILGVGGEPAIAVIYELLTSESGAPVTLELRPLMAGRDIHSLGRAAAEREWVGALDVTDEPTESGGRRLRLQSRSGEPTVFAESSLNWSFSSSPSDSAAGSTWYYNVQLSEERARGFDFEEDLFNPGVLTVALAVGERLVVLLTTEDRPGRDLEALVAGELDRRRGLVRRAAPSSALGARLALAADQFLVRRGVAGVEAADGWSVIAGYPWFADWGRDAMIALPGLCLATGRHEEARGILAAFCAHLSEGMLPNRFPEAGEAPEYNTVDATLWLFVAAWRYLEATGDDAFARATLLPAFDDILVWHARGTRYGIHVDGDGLLAAGEAGVQLTWMDARVGERVVTPRSGKAVEIEALWANALWIAAELHRRCGDAARGRVLGRLARRVRARFEELFWNPAANTLHDVVTPEGPDPSCRPNQLLALGLPFPLLARDKALAVLATVERELVTPRGLRSLAADDPAYVGRYQGGPEARDGAYHQGTVWGWLAGPYVDALLRYRGASGRRRARAYLAEVAEDLREGCVGTLSEIFDGDPPHAPRGAVAQAWSIGELLRALARAEGR